MAKKKKILITGGVGFIGSNFVHYMLQKHPEYDITVLDKLTYAGRIENIEDVLPKITFIKGDICNEEDVEKASDCDIIVNFAAESHVDRSILEASAFIKTNIEGTYVLLEMARRQKISKFLQISTDEVYGSTVSGTFKETDALNASSPYSASKAGAELLVLAYHRTYNLPVMITRSSNNFGPYQYPEKLIPVLIINAMHDKPLPIYGDGSNVRDWLYVYDNSSAIDIILHKGKFGEIYNIGSGQEKRNIAIANLILEALSKPSSLIKFVKDRPGHDFRYSMDCQKIRAMGWKPNHSFEKALQNTIRWYKENASWWVPLLKREIG